MSRTDPAPCSRLLEAAARPLVERARKLLCLERAILQLLPPDLAGHCTVMNLNRDVLILAAPSSAWAARLRFAAPTLLEQLRTRLSRDVRHLQVRIQPDVPTGPHPSSGARPELSLQSAALLARTAQDIDHPGLREALYRLAANAREL